MITRETWVQVTSTVEKIVGRYDGEDYEFLPNEPVSVPIEVARHNFDFGKDDKSASFARLGWAKASEDNSKAMERMRRIRFAAAPPLVEAPLLEEIDASAGERLPDTRTSGSRPIAPGGEGGALADGAPSEPSQPHGVKVPGKPQAPQGNRPPGK